MAPPMPLSKLISIPTPYPQDFGGRMRISLFYQGWAITTLAIMLGVWWAATHPGSWSQRSTKLEKGRWWRHHLIGEVTQNMESTSTCSTSGIDDFFNLFCPCMHFGKSCCGWSESLFLIFFIRIEHAVGVLSNYFSYFSHFSRDYIAEFDAYTSLCPSYKMHQHERKKSESPASYIPTRNSCFSIASCVSWRQKYSFELLLE
jgi:hypothetical protein